jgi:hypothetical protein
MTSRAARASSVPLASPPIDQLLFDGARTDQFEFELPPETMESMFDPSDDGSIRFTYALADEFAVAAAPGSEQQQQTRFHAQGHVAPAIPLPPPVYLGLTGFAFVISISVVRRIFF